MTSCSENKIPSSRCSSMRCVKCCHAEPLTLQENYTEEPIAELEDAPAEEPSKADGGEED